MRARKCSTTLTAWCSLLLTPLAVGAQQTPVDSVCLPRLVDAFVPPSPYWAARSVTTVATTLELLERDGKWTESLDHIIELFREDAQFFTGEGTPSRDNYLQVFAVLDTFWTKLVDEQIRNRRIGVAGAPNFLIDQVNGDFRLLGNAVVIPQQANLNRARSLCLLAHNVRRYHERFTLLGREKAEQELRERVNRWNNFNEKGLTPFPWELALNEFINWFGLRARLEPPKLQLIALRPGVAVDVDDSFGTRANVLAVEVLGLVWYWPGRSFYIAGSFLMSSPSEGPVGWGGMFRVTPTIAGGWVQRDADADGDKDLRLVLSVDAFDLFMSAPKSLIEAAKLATKGRSR